MPGILLNPQRFQPVIFRLAYGGYHHAAVGSWLARTIYTISRAIARDQRSASFDEEVVDKAPVYAARNHCVRRAQELGATHLCMIDADTIPDLYPDKPPFWDTAISFMLQHDKPCIVSAPVLMVGGHVNVHKEEIEGDVKHLRLMKLGEAIARRGMENVPGCGAGLIIIDMRVFEEWPPPYFDFDFTDVWHTDVAAGEDIMFTADASANGFPVFVAWDCWCGHDKRILLRPR